MTRITPSPKMRYRLPRYPTRLQVNQRPTLLAKHQPSAWRVKKEIAAAAALLMSASALSCSRTTPRNDPNAPAVVAPLFEHGSGRAVISCMALLPPAFYSEEAALAIITEELEKHGLDFKDRKVPIKGVDIDRTDSSVSFEMFPWQYQTHQSPYLVDALDPAKKVAVEFVSEEEYYDLGGRYPAMVFHLFSAVASRYDFKGVARDLRQNVKKNGAGVYYGIFYEPVVWEKSWDEKAEANSKVDRDRLLRAQVNDFINWLKAQGVI
jgi:hypothetical protein